MARKQNGFAGMNFQQIMMQQASQSMSSPVYCRFCGHDIKQPTTHSARLERGHYTDWEIQNHAHETCARANYRGNRR